jgi:hypothetical protein
MKAIVSEEMRSFFPRQMRFRWCDVTGNFSDEKNNLPM